MFRCSPPRLTATQLRFDTSRLFAARERTLTVLFPRPLRRTSELFQLGADPYETNNLFNVPAQAALRDSLYVEFNRLLVQTGLGATLSAPTLSATNRQLTLTGGIGPRYEIESAPGLPAAWSPVQEIKMDSFVKTVTDTNAASRGFYRARMIAD